jgi:hypothetical protein
MRKAWVGLVLVLCLLSPLPLLAEELSIVRAEAPQFTEVAKKARLKGDALVRVRIDPAGEVLSSMLEKDLPLGLGQAAAEAARHFKFSPSREGETRESLLAFVFDQQEAPPGEQDHVEESWDGPLTLRVVYLSSTVIWLPRENGEIPEKLCPLHATPMSVEQVVVYPLGCGMYVVAPEAQRRAAEWETYETALAAAQKDLFPQSNRFITEVYAEKIRAEVYYCQACRDAEKAWREGHPEPGNSDLPPAEENPPPQRR